MYIMKKLLFTLGLCLVVTITVGQKKAVTEALKFAKEAKNYAEARTKIKGALEHEDTKNDARTWYIAGQIENLQLEAEIKKLTLGQQANDAAMYSALIEIYPYFKKAYELDQLPDAKGKIKTKYAKDIKSALKVNLNYYMNGAKFFYDKGDFKNAIGYFEQFIEIRDSPFIKEGGKAPETVDSMYILANFYAAMTAIKLNEHEIAVKALTRACKIDHYQNEIFQYLAEEYKRVNDTLSWEKTLNEGLALFPKEEYFLFNLILIYSNTNREIKALEFINTAIQNSPDNPQLYELAGRIYETRFNDYAKAEESFKRSLELNPENAEANSYLGCIYFNQGVIKLKEASVIADSKKYNEEKAKVLVLFRKALPFLEKAFTLDPEANDNKVALRSIYYNLNMDDKLSELEKHMNTGN